MAAFDTTTTSDDFSGAASTSYSFNHTVTGSNPTLVLAFAVTNATEVVTGVTYNGVTMTQATKVNDAGGSDSVTWGYIYILPNAPTGTHAVNITTSASVFHVAIAASYTTTNTSSQPDGTTSLNYANSSTADVTATITTTTAGDWGVLFVFGGRSPVASTGSTLRATNANGQSALYDSNGAFASTGSNSMAFHSSSTGGPNMNYLMVGIKSAAAATTSHRLSLLGAGA